MSQPKMSASATAVWSWAPAASTASKSELSMRAAQRAAAHLERVLQHVGLSARRVAETLRVWLSFSRRSSPNSAPSLCVRCSDSPGRRLSRPARMPGRLRSEARSARLSFRRRKMRSSVSLRRDDHVDGREREPLREGAAASCAPRRRARAQRHGAAPARRGGGRCRAGAACWNRGRAGWRCRLAGCQVRGLRARRPATTPHAAACSQKIEEGIRAGVEVQRHRQLLCG